MALWNNDLVIKINMYILLRPEIIKRPGHTYVFSRHRSSGLRSKIKFVYILQFTTKSGSKKITNNQVRIVAWNNNNNNNNVATCKLGVYKNK